MMLGPKTLLGKFRVSANPIKYKGSALRRSPNSLISKAINCACKNYNHNSLCKLRYELYRNGLVTYPDKYEVRRVIEILQIEDLCALAEGEFAIRYSAILKGQKKGLNKKDLKLIGFITKTLIRLYKLKYWKAI
ncbi:hypothetical protein HYY74_01090 [Candidatus Woesearchaeota archaeon]|nr:hypothetical protein [Candidatus Woesearchaeota archaeon]